MNYLIKMNFSLLYRIIILFSLVIYFPILGSSQQFPSKFLSLEDGLPQNMYRVVQDEQGYMWILSSDAIARYDGYNFNFFTIQDGLPDNDVFNFIPDVQGRNWLMNNNNHFAYQRGDSIKTFDIPTKGRLNILKKDSISTDISNNILVRRFFIDDSYKEIELHKYLYDYIYPNNSKDTLSNYEQLMIQDSLGNQVEKYDTYYRHLTVQKLLDFFNKKNKFRGLTKDLLVDSMFSSTTYQTVFQECLYDQTLQFFTENYHFTFDNEFNLINSIRIKNPENRLIKAVLKDINGDYWLVSKDGIYILNKNYIQNKIKWLPYTQDINILGIKKYKNRLILYSSDNNIYSYSQSNNKVYFLNKIYAAPSTKSIRNLKQIEIINDELYYVYPKRELNSIPLAKNVQENSTLVEDLISQYAGALTKLSYQDTLLFFTKRNKVGRIHLKSRKTSIFFEGRSTDIDHSEGTTYLAGIDSLYIYKNSNLEFKVGFKDIKQVVGISNRSYVVINKMNQCYFCTDIDCNEIKELKGKKVKDLLLIGDNYWFIYNRGVIKSNYIPMEGFVLKKDYKLAEILNVNQINDLIIKDSIATVATDKGLFEFNHNKFKIIPDSFPLLIETIETPDKTYSYSSEIILPYDERSLTIHCSALSFKDNKPIEYHYIMKGNDDKITNTINSKIRYTNLTPGNYEFVVFSINEYGSKSNTRSFNLKIKKPWWQTYIFYLLTLGMILIGFWYLVKRRINKIKEKSRIEQKFAELELNALQSQMNPHFVFNAMSSMQNLIQQKDFINSDSYLAKFSRLMRMYLESSKQKYIPIKDELDIIEIYFSLEKLRFQEKISLRIENKLSSELLNTKIPSSLIQPFIENAINHGLFHKQESGKIILRLYEKSNAISIEIEDDGVGRAKSEEINKGFFKPKSRAIGIIDDKIKAIKKMDNYNLNYEIIDLYDTQNKPLGTKVIVQINL